MKDVLEKATQIARDVVLVDMADKNAELLGDLVYETIVKYTAERLATNPIELSDIMYMQLLVKGASFGVHLAFGKLTKAARTDEDIKRLKDCKLAAYVMMQDHSRIIIEELKDDGATLNRYTRLKEVDT